MGTPSEMTASCMGRSTDMCIHKDKVKAILKSIKKNKSYKNPQRLRRDVKMLLRDNPTWEFSSITNADSKTVFCIDAVFSYSHQGCPGDCACAMEFHHCYPQRGLVIRVQCTGAPLQNTDYMDTDGTIRHPVIDNWGMNLEKSCFWDVTRLLLKLFSKNPPHKLRDNPPQNPQWTQPIRTTGTNDGSRLAPTAPRYENAPSYVQGQNAILQPTNTSSRHQELASELQSGNAPSNVQELQSENAPSNVQALQSENAPSNVQADDTHSQLPSYERMQCNICMEENFNVVFSGCGHVACGTCASQLDKCHMCRTTISTVVKLFLPESTPGGRSDATDGSCLRRGVRPG